MLFFCSFFFFAWRLLKGFFLLCHRYGAGVLEDDFVSELSTSYTSSAHFMCFYGLLNFYTFAMAYVYSPAQMQPHGTRSATLMVSLFSPCFCPLCKFYFVVNACCPQTRR